VVEWKLHSVPFLGKAHVEFEETHIAEVPDLSLVSIAFSSNRRGELEQALQDSLGLALPSPGRSEMAADGSIGLFWMAPDQLLALASGQESDQTLLDHVRNVTGNAGYYTNQTDNWCALRLGGNLAMPALERVCPLDLHVSVFPMGSVARTVMEHIHTVIHRENERQFLLLSPSSSAQSFMHAITASLRNVSV